MRLTLRTLLAYLDDVLAPADTKMIGQKIQESPMAQLLVSRIREVMRRRRLKAPEVVGPEMGIDPNIVSQYLDNTLPPERYADVERVLLASDEMLAEAAACHQVLTLILANPTEVSEASRERLYALGPVESKSQLRVPEGVPVVTRRTPESISTRNGTAASHVEAISSRGNDDERITTLPDYLKPAPWSQSFLPSALVALLIIVCAVLLAPGFMTGFQRASTEIQRKVVRDKSEPGVIAKNDLNPVEFEAPSMEIHLAQDTVAAPPRPTTLGTVGVKIPEGIDPTPPDDVSDLPPTKMKPEPVVPDTEPPNDGFVPPRPGNEVPMVARPVSPVANPTPIPAEPQTVPPITYSSSDGALVRLDEEHHHWFIVPHRSAMKAGEIVANLEPFDGVIEFEKSGLRTTLVGETVVRFLVPIEAGIRGLGIGRGRILIQHNRQEENQTGAIGIGIGEDVWKLELLTNDTVCALEVSVREPTQFQKLNDYHWYQATLSTISGAARWTNREGISQNLGDHSALNIIPEKAATVRSIPISFPSAPDWCDSGKRKAQPLRRYQAPFEKSFDVDQPVDQSMLTLVKNSKNPKIAELAAHCLSATDNYAALVQTLAECPHEEARFAARDGLRQWLPMSPDGSNGLKLKAELETHYPQADAEAAYRMLWGFSREDVKDSKATSWLFTNWMRSSRLEIREMADYWVERLTGRKTEYKALDHRESHIRRIEEQIERDNGLIKGP